MRTTSLTLTLARFASAALLTMFLAGCTNVDGTYNCQGGLLDSVKLDSGKADVTMSLLGTKQEHQGTYTVDGNKVTIAIDGQSTVFTLSGKTLTGGEMAGTCTAK